MLSVLVVAPGFLRAGTVAPVLRGGLRTATPVMDAQQDAISQLLKLEDQTPAQLQMQIDTLERLTDTLKIQKLQQQLVESSASVPSSPAEILSAQPMAQAAAESVTAAAPPAFSLESLEPAAPLVAPAAPLVAQPLPPIEVPDVSSMVISPAASSIVTSPAAEGGFLSDPSSVPWTLFLVAFTVFPAAVIIFSEASKPQPADTAPNTAPRKIPGQGRDAQEIFFTGLENLSKEPTGWMFGKPSPLYSNRPQTAITSDAKGVVVPTETLQERAARERAEDEARGRF